MVQRVIDVFAVTLRSAVDETAFPVGLIGVEIGTSDINLYDRRKVVTNDVPSTTTCMGVEIKNEHPRSAHRYRLVSCYR